MSRFCACIGLVGVVLGLGGAVIFAQPPSMGVATAVPGAVRDMHLMARETGWILTGQQILWTTTDGQSWADISPLLEKGQQIDRAYFLDSQHGWALVHVLWVDQADPPEISVASTNNGGTKWSLVPLNASLFVRQSYGSRAYFSFPDEMHGWLMLQKASGAAYSRGDLFCTQDGGKTWSALPAPPVAGDIRFFSDSTGWLIGGISNDQLYHTPDGGRTWKQVSMALPSGVQPYSIPEGLGLTYHSHAFYVGPHFTDEGHGVLVATLDLKQQGDPILLAYKTSDGGETWTIEVVKRGADFTGSPVLYDLDFVQLETSSRALRLHHDSHEDVVPLPGDYPDGSWIAKADLLDPQEGWLLSSGGTLISLRNGTTRTVMSPVLTK